MDTIPPSSEGIEPAFQTIPTEARYCETGGLAFTYMPVPCGITSTRHSLPRAPVRSRSLAESGHRFPRRYVLSYRRVRVDVPPSPRAVTLQFCSTSSETVVLQVPTGRVHKGDALASGHTVCIHLATVRTRRVFSNSLVLRDPTPPHPSLR